MITGKILKGQDNLSYSVIGFFDKEGNKVVCKGCKSINSPYYFDKELNLKKKSLDFSSTYEGAVIVSKKFKDYCLTNKYSNIIFVPLNHVDGYYYFHVVRNWTEVDITLSGITIKGICCECGYFKEVFGGLKIYTKDAIELYSGFLLTDIFWRTHYVFRQEIIVDLQTAQDLKAQKFKGLYFDNIFHDQDPKK